MTYGDGGGARSGSVWDVMARGLPEGSHAADSHFSPAALWARHRNKGNTMKGILVGIAVVGLGFLGCTKSVERAQRDVQRTHDQAVRNIDKKQGELRDEKRDAEERIAQKERRLQDTTREETDKVRKEQRQLDDAVRAENRREDARRDEARRSETTPDTTAAPLPPE